jgi:thioredoxin 1
MMLNRRQIFAAVLATGAGLSLVALRPAAASQPFDQAAFAAAQAAGKPIMIHVTAPWCPTCRAQNPILSRLLAEPRFKNVVVFDVDFDSQKDLLRAFQVRVQSTMIVFKGHDEAGRSSGDTNAASIEELLSKAV